MSKLKAVLQSPKFYIWTVLVLLPAQALMFIYTLRMDNAAWASLFMKQQSERFAAFNSAASKLMWISLALFVVDIACLLIAVGRLENQFEWKSKQSKSGVQPLRTSN